MAVTVDDGYGDILRRAKPLLERAGVCFRRPALAFALRGWQRLHDEFVFLAQKLRVFRPLETGAPRHQLEQDAVIRHALGGEIAHDLVL